MEPATPQARAVVAELQRRVTARRTRWQPRPLPAPPVRTPMTANESLEYLHTHWVLPDSFTAVPAGAPWKQRLWRIAGRLTFGVLARYLADERELLSKAVQVCDTLARRVDTLEAEIEQLAALTSQQLAELAAYLPDAVDGVPAVDDEAAVSDVPAVDGVPAVSDEAGAVPVGAATDATPAGERAGSGPDDGETGSR